MVYSNGTKYNGQFKDGKKQGKRVFLYNNGDKYEGEWKNDMKNGKGRYTWPKDS